MPRFEVYGPSGATLSALHAMLMTGMYNADGFGTAVPTFLPISFPAALLFGDSSCRASST